MNRARACATALLATALAAAALPAGALSLGAPQLESHLGEPLRLRIPLRDDNPAQGRMEVQVGRLELPAMAERPQRGVVGGFVAELRQERNAAVSELLIRSREPVREPVLHLMLELRQGDSQWLRQIDVLLDPLPVPPREIPATAAGPAVVAARPLPPGTQSDSAPNPRRVAPPSSASPAQTQDAAANTAGDTAADTAGQRPAAAQPRLTLRRRPAPTTPPRVAQGDPWEVRRGDTLSGIAQRVPRPAGVSYARFMEALRLANPGAFETPGDVRTLRVGAQLRAPDATTLDRAASTLAAAAQRPPSRAATLPASGGIFLMGDAAHRFPPTGGLGLNTGVADAQGLTWRLGAVADGWAHPSILDTYETERRPVAGVNCEQSTTNAFKLATLIEALGIPSNPTTEGMLARLADPAHEASIAAAVREQQTHFDMLGLQLGYCYADGALARDGDPPAPIDDPGEFEPHADVGARLPHAWLDDGRSTLDLVDLGTMTLLSVGAHDKWAAAASDSNVPVCHVRIGLDATPTDGWAAVCGLDGDGALLVRPDQHVAWRSDSVTTPGPSGLNDALRLVLGAP